MGAPSALARERQDERAVLTRGLYLNQGTLQTEEKLQAFLRLARAFRLDSFVVDMVFPSARYARCVRQIQASGVSYVPRVVVFPPDGGTSAQVLRRDYWDTRLRLVETAMELGARRVQLDYIRYRASTPPSRQNAFDILRVVEFFAERIHKLGGTVEIDVFGDAAGGPSARIGQDLRLLGPHVDGVCPMAYPSHYRPYQQTWKMPYQIVNSSVRSARRLMGKGAPPITAYIEMFNFRHPMVEADRAVYVRSQLQGAARAGARGWYAWSSTNSYGLLFDLIALYGDELEQGAPEDG